MENHFPEEKSDIFRGKCFFRKRNSIFPMANGAGLMAESGAEGILPLKRGKDGKLGVIAQGGGVGSSCPTAKIRENV